MPIGNFRYIVIIFKIQVYAVVNLSDSEEYQRPLSSEVGVERKEPISSAASGSEEQEVRAVPQRAGSEGQEKLTAREDDSCGEGRGAKDPGVRSPPIQAAIYSLYRANATDILEFSHKECSILILLFNLIKVFLQLRNLKINQNFNHPMLVFF